MLELNSELICVVTADLGEMQQIGLTPHGARMIAPVTGGSFKGPKLNGELLPFGADWLLFRADGVGEIDVRLTFRTDDEAFLYCQYRGILAIQPDLMGKIQTGEDVDPSEYYFRITPIFETGSEKYQWLNNIVCVGVGKLSQNQVQYSLYQIL
jgi:hypothetical protein